MTRAVFILFLWVCALCASSLPALCDDPDGSGQCLSGNCTNGFGVYLNDDHSLFEGDFHDGLFDGNGTLTHAVGSVYAGQFAEGCPSGHGVYTDWRGNRHDGEFFLGWEHGPGEYRTADGARYQGFFNRGFRDGPGLFVNTDGTVRHELWDHGDFVRELTRGQYRDECDAYAAADHDLPEKPWRPVHPAGCIRGDCRNGMGVFVFENGQRYEGPFKDGKSHGTGWRYYPNGDTYHGEESEGLRHGNGVYRFRDGQRYEGPFYRDRREGMGRFVHRDGSVFMGMYRRDRRHGVGRYTAPDGTRTYGLWENGGYVRAISRQEFEVRLSWEPDSHDRSQEPADGQ